MIDDSPDQPRHDDADAERGLLRVVLEATRHLDARESLDALTRGAVDLLGAAWGLGYLVGDSGDDLECMAVSGRAGAETLRDAVAVLDAGLLRHIAPSGGARRLPGDVLLADALEPPLEVDVGEAALVPLESGRGVAGLLVVFASGTAALHPNALAILDRLSLEMRPALDNAHAVDGLRALVIRDDTADCYNRRYLDRCLEDEVERSRRFGTRFALIFLDMDNLKQVNTAYGHAAGSQALYEASVRIARSVRSIDRVFRYGGDEFVVVLPGTGAEGAKEVAERIRREIAEAPFLLAHAGEARLTVSAGVAAWPAAGATARDVVAAADSAMRVVKTQGKDRVAIAGEVTEER